MTLSTSTNETDQLDYIFEKEGKVKSLPLIQAK